MSDPRDTRISQLEAELDMRGAQIAKQEAKLAEQAAQIAEQEAKLVEQAAQIAELLEKLNQNSSNSHKPPSSDPPANRSVLAAKLRDASSLEQAR